MPGITDISPIFTNVILVAAIAGLVQVLRGSSTFLDTYAPIVSVVAGVVLCVWTGVGAGHSGGALASDAETGVILGLVATGAFAYATKFGGASSAPKAMFKRLRGIS